MLYEIHDATVSLGGNEILSHLNFEVRGTEKAALVGRNGSGKTTLLRLIAGELTPDRDDKRQGPCIVTARALTIGYLRQMAQEERHRTVEELVMEGCPAEDAFSRERYSYEAEYDRLLTGFGLKKEDKARKLESFSGGEQTKIQMIRLFLSRPDILLLDEPTNHLDLRTTQWLEEYLRQYPKAVIFVSHDRYFLDQTADVVWEMERGKCIRYPGNYSEYRRQKSARLIAQQKAYEREQEEIARLNDLIKRFRNKPRKASFAQSRKKILERMEHVEKPLAENAVISFDPIVPEKVPAKWVIEAEDLKIGYTEPIAELSLRVRRGQKLAILGENGCGKSTLLKTVAGRIQGLSGKCLLGNRVEIGYFDQMSAQLCGEESVIEHFRNAFPALTDHDARNYLAKFLFRGKDCAKRVGDLSGGEKARLVFCEMLFRKPNLLLLDEPTNHMDLSAKEAIEEALRAYEGTLLLVSHDRYLISRTTDQLLLFEPEGLKYYPFGYDHYREKLRSGRELRGMVDAKDQALLAGLQAVPKAERHETRPLSTEEASGDWQLRLAREVMDRCRVEAEDLLEVREQSATAEEWEDRTVREEEALERYAQACADWWEMYQGSAEERQNAEDT